MKRKAGPFLAFRLSWLAYLPLAAFAFYYSLRYGLRGFAQAADVSYYGGWLVANGDLPLVDFFASYGAVQYLIQGALMKLFGPSWLVYCAHAAIINAAYTVLIFYLLRRLGLPLWIAFVYAWCAAITYYPSMGYPQPDKHSFLFLILGLVFQLQVTGETKSRTTAAFYALAAFSYLAALFCKGSPTILYPLAALAVMLGLERRQWLAALAGIALFCVGAGLLSLAVLAKHPDFHADLFYYLVTLPGRVASERMGGSLPFLKLGTYTQSASFTLAYAALIAGAGLLAARPGALADGRNRDRMLIPLLLAFSFVVITIFHATHLAQPPAPHVTLIVPAIALAHAALLSVIKDSAAARPARLAVTLLLLVFVAVDTSEYNRTVVKRRISYDVIMNIDGTQARGTSGVPELADVEYIPLTDIPDYLDKFTQVLTAVKQAPGNVFLVGLSPWYYAFGQKAPVLPAVYVLPGHSTPPPDSPEEIRLAGHLATNLERHTAGTLLAAPDKFDAVLELLNANELACGVETARYFVKIDLCRPVPADRIDIARRLLALNGN